MEPYWIEIIERLVREIILLRRIVAGLDAQCDFLHEGCYTTDKEKRKPIIVERMDKAGNVLVRDLLALQAQHNIPGAIGKLLKLIDESEGKPT